jgi:hypothetical protein
LDSKGGTQGPSTAQNGRSTEILLRLGMTKNFRVDKSAEKNQTVQFQRKEEKSMSTPSTTIVTNLKGLSSPTANTVADSVAVGLDVNGMQALALTKAYELKSCLTLLVAHTDSADPNLATFNNILASLT